MDKDSQGNPLFPSREEFSRLVEITFARASAFQEIIELLDKDKLANGIKNMSEALEKPDKNFQIGSNDKTSATSQ